MTPKEKAIQLINSYLVALVGTAPLNEHTSQNDIDFAAEGALIALDEVIKALTSIKDIDVRGSVLLDLIEHYRGVKEEIENYLR